MDPQSPNRLIATKYCFLILGDNTSFFFFISLFFVFLFLCVCVVVVVILCYFLFLQKLFFYFIVFIFFSSKLFLFFHVPGCSGMLRNVPCSGFYRHPVAEQPVESPI